MADTIKKIAPHPLGLLQITNPAPLKVGEGRTSLFSGERRKVWSRRYLAAGARADEGPESTPLRNRLRRLGGDCRPSEIELFAGDPDAMHDHGKLASHGNGGPFHAPAMACHPGRGGIVDAGCAPQQGASLRAVASGAAWALI